MLPSHLDHVDPPSSVARAARAGNGAARISLLPGRYVYGAWSRRAGGASLGIDLTPGGECSVACVYCQVPRGGSAKGRPIVDVPVLGAELDGALAKPPEGGWADLAFAGSGEPTLAANFGSALDEILAALARASFTAPRRIYTNGLQLGVLEVEKALARWIAAGGEVWAKLDAVDDESIERVWRVRLSARAHLAKLWQFAARWPIGLQCTLFHAEGLAPLAETGRRLAEELVHARAAGAQIHGVHLLAPSRKPGDEEASTGLVAASLAELEAVAQTIRSTIDVSLKVYP